MPESSGLSPACRAQNRRDARSPLDSTRVHVGETGIDMRAIRGFNVDVPAESPLPPPPIMDASQNRREFKFLLPPDEGEAFRGFVTGHIPVDPVAEKGYPVISEYFDTPDRHSYWQKAWGARNRRRVRARVYGRADGSIPPSGFVEIKHKLDTLGVKRRAAVPIAELPLLSQGRIPPSLMEPGCPGAVAHVVQELKDLVLREGARPVVQLRYERTAYDTGPDGSIRITFDTGLRCRFDLKPLAADDSDFQLSVLENDATVVEVKTIGPVPVWLRQAAGRFHLHACSMSKYGRALERFDPAVARHLSLGGKRPVASRHLVSV